MNEKNTPTHAREDSASHVIKVLNQLKELLTLSQSDPLCRQATALYDNVERTLKEAYRELEAARYELSRNENAIKKKPGDS